MRSGEKNEGTQTEIGPELPDDLWSMIAGLVGQKDWARVSGTCKTFHRIQLRVINLRSNRQDELLWLSKRWKTAEALVIQDSSLAGREASADANAYDKMSAAGAHWPHNLRYLSVHASKDHIGEEDPPLPQWVQQVISNAHKVEVLVLNLMRPVLMLETSMAALKHLAITALASAMPANWACVESLRCLETLHIAVYPHNTGQDNCSMPTSAMRLLGCRSLRALHMKNVVPADLEVSAKCRVTFMGMTVPMAVGDSISPGYRQGIMAILRACAIFSIVVHTRSQMSVLESALGQPLVQLEELEIYFTLDNGPRAAPCGFEIYGAMPRLTRLRVEHLGSPINIIVSNHVHLRSLRVTGYLGSFAFTPVHAASMFRDIEQVEMLWSGDEPNHVRILAPYLEARCTESGNEWTLQQPNSDDQQHIIDEDEDEDSDEFEDRHGSFRWLLGGDGEINRWESKIPEDMISSGSPIWNKCAPAGAVLKCGACEGCLEQDGVAQMYR